MAIEDAAATVPLSHGERLAGLNHINDLREKVFGLNIEPELERFLKDMRDPRDVNNKQNVRILAAMLFAANIPARRHNITVSEMTEEEKNNLKEIINAFRAAVGLFPKWPAIPKKPA